ncbi:11672_t:CDS:2, partial [Ambispora gerdemannii]
SSIISFSWNSSQKNESKVRQAPNSIPAIYSGVRVVVYAILAKGIEPKTIINLSAQSPDSPIKLDVKVDPVTLHGSKIHTLAARKLIQDLEEGTSYLHADSIGKEKVFNDLVKKQIINLGITFSLASRHTSFLAINEKTNSEIARSETLKQKREVPGHVRSFARRSAIMPRSLKSSRMESYKRKKSSYSLVSMKRRSMSNEDVSSYEDLITSAILPVSVPSLQAQKQELSLPFDIKSPNIETLYEFLKFQSFDGKFVAKNSNFSSLFSGHDSMKDEDSVWTTAVAMAYLEIVMKEFKEEWELCFEKAERALTDLIGKNDESKKVENILAEAHEWVQKWVASK